ncbi:hypothetical protein HanRHA438_Chr06g0253081 [Helianthus annuus]|nr:hypothetical protein HanRHA438_Chr06g0253081 [Helianthus annuus]
MGGELVVVCGEMGRLCGFELCCVVATLLLMNLWLDRKRQGGYLFRCEFGGFCYALELLDLFIVNVFWKDLDETRF